MGVDLAKYQDFTVITVIDLHTFKVQKQERFNQIDWNLQKAKIEAMYLRYGKPLIYIDSTGVGDPIYEDLFRKGLRVDSFQFTERSRKDLLNNLALKLEQDKIKIPDNDVLHNELMSMKYELTERGKIKLVVPEGLHDDCIMSLALACWNMPENPLPAPNSLRFLMREQEEHYTPENFM
jgi:phage FluMu gp28-like protein